MYQREMDKWSFRPSRRQLRLRADQGTAIAGCWRGICLIIAGQILVALKRNDEYALIIKVMRA